MLELRAQCAVVIMTPLVGLRLGYNASKLGKQMTFKKTVLQLLYLLIFSD